MCDVQILVENACLSAHKLILAACSPYFRAMFRANNFDESTSKQIKIDPKGDLGIKAEAVESLIEYMYTGKIALTQSNAVDIIKASDLFELTAVKSTTLKFIEDYISFETYVDIQEVGSLFNCQRLLMAVDKFIHKNFSQFMRTDGFFALTEEQLTQYLSHDHLKTETEEEIFDAVLDWCKRHERLDHFPVIAELIRFNLISIKHVLKTMNDDRSITANSAVTSFLIGKLHGHCQSLSVGVSRPRFSTRVLVAMPYASRNFYVITFHGGDNIEFSVHHFPSSISEHVEGLTNFSVCRVGQGSSLMYLAGGQHVNPLDTFLHGQGLVYDVLKDQWCPAPSLPPHPHDFTNFTMAAAGGRVYILCSDGAVYASAIPIECIDPVCECHRPTGDSQQPSSDGHPAAARIEWAVLNDSFVIGHRSDSTWQSVQRMNFARTSVSLVGIGKRLYALGGMQDGGFTSLVEMYDTGSNEWHNVENMGEARCNPGIAVAGGKIYVVGGVGDRDVNMRQGPERFAGALRTVEYYDPEADTWSQLPDMYFPRYSPAVAHVNNKLFVFGGGSPEQMARPGPESTIECFDFERHEWFVLQTKVPGTSDAYYVCAFFDYLET